jgi:hypothetical protein
MIAPGVKLRPGSAHYSSFGFDSSFEFHHSLLEKFEAHHHA